VFGRKGFVAHSLRFEDNDTVHGGLTLRLAGDRLSWGG
jgi:hypothetical protein